MKNENKNIFLKGVRDGAPIGAGYFAVSFSLGILAKKAGLTPIMGFFSSLFTRASAGEYGTYTLIASDATYVSVILMSLVTNLRYLLMGTALTQKFDEKTSLLNRIFVGTCITDEIFGISIAYPGKLNPIYTYGATAIAAPLWALGCALGVVAGGVLPTRVVSALSVALYGMFIAIIVPPSKKNKAVLVAVLCSFALSFICKYLPYISSLSSGTRTIILTILIASVAALIKPVEVEE